MNVLEKVARLERLLARVRERGVRLPGAPSLVADVRVIVRDDLAAERGRHPPAPPLRRGFESSADLARFIEEDHWESPRAPSSAPPHVATLPPPYGWPSSEPTPDDWVVALPLTPRVASIDHGAGTEGLEMDGPSFIDPMEAPYSSDLLDDETPEASAPEEFTPAPPELGGVGREKAVLLATASRRPRFDSSVFWEEAARELERRPSSIPPPISSGMLPPAPGVRAPTSRWLETSAEETEPRWGAPSEREQPAAFSTAPPSAPAPPSSPVSEIPSSAEARSRRRRSFRTIPPRRRLVKPPSMVVKIHGGLAALGVIGAVAVLWVVLRSPPSTGAPDRGGVRPDAARVDARPDPAREAPSSTTPGTGAPIDEDTASGRGEVGAIEKRETTLPPAPLDAPPASEIPEDHAALRVLVTPPRWVFINGRKAGESNAWLTVPCGWRHVRLAERQPPPPGASFPAWTNEGHSVLIPCGEASEIALAE